MAAPCVADADIICCIGGFFLLSFFLVFRCLLSASNGNKVKVRVRRNVSRVDGSMNPWGETSMGESTMGRTVNGAKSLDTSLAL